MTTILDIPEVVALDTRRGLVRIPPEVDVPLTPRVRQLIDTADFRRLARISQLGWCRWSIRRPSTPVSSTAWASTAWPCSI